MTTQKQEDRIPVEVLQQAIEDSGLTAGEAARLLEWEYTAFRRSVGLAKETSNGKYRKTMSYEKAAEIVTGLGLWPVDYGL